MNSSPKHQLKKEIIKMLLTIGSTLVLAILLHECPKFLLLIAKSLAGALANIGSDLIVGMLTTSPPETALQINKKHKRRRHRGYRKYSRWKKRKAKNQRP